MKNVRLSQAETEANKLAKALHGGEVLALIGDLGSGKTTFTKALGKALGVRSTITSPTFVMMQQYQTTAKNKEGKPLWLYHLDLYRTNNFSEVKSLGVEQYWGHPETITVIEWADKIIDQLPKEAVLFKFTRDAK
ncbi:MAG TPA: tRNA (adenosine(37)-N6)-threonylcarbamoyltransferase complex ATPase subunit type 1 TsaE [Candidatus Doudnabacteria bacterium]|nr:tRNA (adenosine(37)-N6)-threonylcarbamoyltransferase complex ATPase subunit type 1 TsaE [Candidatus Doudnabacteria bacterium]